MQPDGGVNGSLIRAKDMLRLIAHTHRDEVRSACISVRWLAGRREMLEWGSDYLDNAEAGNKVNLTVVHGEAA